MFDSALVKMPFCFEQKWLCTFRQVRKNSESVLRAGLARTVQFFIVIGHDISKVAERGLEGERWMLQLGRELSRHHICPCRVFYTAVTTTQFNWLLQPMRLKTRAHSSSYTYLILSFCILNLNWCW